MLFAAPVAAVKDMYVVGLFKDRAVLMIDGKRRVLTAGNPGAEGVRLISANSEAAVLEIDGKRQRLTPEMRLSSAYVEPTHAEIQISRDPVGMYRTVGSINGRTVSFLVDTGATSIAMNSVEAQRLGIDYRSAGKKSMVSTASGFEQIHQVQLNSVRVGEIELTNVSAAVLEGEHPTEVLLGMSFLGRLDMRNDGQSMVLRKKF